MPCARHGRTCGDPPPVFKCPSDSSYYAVRRQLGKGGFARVFSVTRLPPNHPLVSSYEAQNPGISQSQANQDSLTTSSTTSSSPSTSSFASPSLNVTAPISTSTTTTTTTSGNSASLPSVQIFTDIRPPALPPPQTQRQPSSHTRRPRSYPHRHSTSTSSSIPSSASANFALKVISKCRVASSSAGREALRSEVLIHSRLRHPSIVSLQTFWEDHYRVYLLLDLVEGPSLDAHVRSRRRLSEPEAAIYLSQIFEALSYLHANHVVHKDIKLANLLLSPDLSRVHLCDFGLSAFVDTESMEHLSPVCGTPNYVAPELLSPSSSSAASAKREHEQNGNSNNNSNRNESSHKAKDVIYTSSADIWSMGIVMFSMLIGCGPFDGDDVNRTFRKIRTARFTFPIGIRLSVLAKSLIRSLLSENPNKRPSADEAILYPFFTAATAAAVAAAANSNGGPIPSNTSKSIRATAHRLSLRAGDRNGVGVINTATSGNHGNVSRNGIGFRRSRVARERDRIDRGTGDGEFRQRVKSDRSNGNDSNILPKPSAPGLMVGENPRAHGYDRGIEHHRNRDRTRERDRERDRDREKVRDDPVDKRRGKRSPSLMDENASTWRRKEEATIGRPNYDRAASLTHSSRGSKGNHNGGHDHHNQNNNQNHNHNHNHNNSQRHSSNRHSLVGGNRISGAVTSSSRQQQYETHNGRMKGKYQRASWTVANDLRKEVVNLCMSVSAALVKARQLLDEDEGRDKRKTGLKRADAVCEEVDPARSAPPMVRRWLDYTSKYGFATLMDGGRVGCCFNDGSIMFVVSESERGVPDVAYVAADGADEHDDDTEAEKERKRNNVSEKVCLCKMFAGLMMTGDVGGRGGVSAATLSGLPSAFNMSLLQRDEDIILGKQGSNATPSNIIMDNNKSSSSRQVVHVREWARLKHGRAAAFRLSNHSVHVKFDVGDDVCEDYVFDLQRKTVFYRPAKAATARVCRLVDLAAMVSLSEVVYNQMLLCSQALNRFLE